MSQPDLIAAQHNVSPENDRTAPIQTRWRIYVLPWLIFMVFTSLEPHPQKASFSDLSVTEPTQSVACAQYFTENYPLMYTLKIMLTSVAIFFSFPQWRRMFPLHISFYAILVGILGVILWVGIGKLEIEKKVFRSLTSPSTAASEKKADSVKLENVLSSTRSSFNPFAFWPHSPEKAWGFFLIRMVGLALLVPLLEEFFLRGFLLRWMSSEKWWEADISLSTGIIWGGTIFYAVTTHPSEALAASVWFSLITWLVIRTRNIWNAVTAHCVTNFLLGIYVLYTGEWFFL